MRQKYLPILTNHIYAVKDTQHTLLVYLMNTKRYRDTIFLKDSGDSKVVSFDADEPTSRSKNVLTKDQPLVSFAPFTLKPQLKIRRLDEFSVQLLPISP